MQDSSRLTPDSFGAASSSGAVGMGLPNGAAGGPLPYALVPEPYTPSLFGEFSDISSQPLQATQ